MDVNTGGQESLATYCRDIETYLCRKNDGHLIRIVGPAFEQVYRWAERGVPLNVAFRGIDRYFERYYAKGARRRPVRVEFCEADVLDAFDEWRRAVGVTTAATGTGESSEHDDTAPAGEERGPHTQVSLPRHLERTIARLTSIRANSIHALDEVVDAAVRELDGARAASRSLRGPQRDAFLARLRTLDASLLDAACASLGAAAMAGIGADADTELAPFRDRMPRDAYANARRAAVERLVRERLRLPKIAYDA